MTFTTDSEKQPGTADNTTAETAPLDGTPVMPMPAVAEERATHGIAPTDADKAERAMRATITAALANPAKDSGLAPAATEGRHSSGLAPAATEGQNSGLKPAGTGSPLNNPWIKRFWGTMLVSLVLYCVLFGTLGGFMAIFLIAVHEMGHWVWMKANKMEPHPPAFIPFFGAFVAPKQPASNEATAAWVALAGPLVGGIGAAVLWGAGIAFQQPWFVVGGLCGFTLNLLQLLPARPFDGGNVVAALSRFTLIPGTLVLVYLAIAAHSPILILLSVFSIAGLFVKPAMPAPKLTHSGTAQTIGELERELLAAPAPAAAADVPQPSNKLPRSNMTPATMKQRFAIGLSYLVVGGALLAGPFVGIIPIVHNAKPYAGLGIQAFSDQIKVKDNAASRVIRAICYAIQDRFAEAENDAAVATKLNNKNQDAYCYRAEYRLLQGINDQTVVDSLMKSAQLSKKGSLDAWNAAYDLAACGHYDEAVACSPYLTKNASNSIKAIALDRTGHSQEAGRLYDDLATKASSEYWGSWARRAIHSLADNQTAKAKIDIDKLSKAAAISRPSYSVIHGWYSLRIGELDQALKDADNVFKPSINDLQAFQSRYIKAAAHRLKAEVYARKAHTDGNETATKKDRELSASEQSLSHAIPGLGTLYIPQGVENW